MRVCTLERLHRILVLVLLPTLSVYLSLTPGPSICSSGFVACIVRPVPTTDPVATQVPVEDWHARFLDPTTSDAVLDRLVHTAYRLQLRGDPQLRSPLPIPPTWLYNAYAGAALVRWTMKLGL